MAPSIIADLVESVGQSAEKLTGNGSNSGSGNMNTSMVKSKFLSHPEDLGVVAVGFSGGQVSSWSFPKPSRRP